MTDLERAPYLDEQAIQAAVTQMLIQNDWRLIEANALARRVALALTSAPVIHSELVVSVAEPVVVEQSVGSDRPWRQRRRGGSGHARMADPVACAALRIYSELLYAAFANQQDEGRQQRAYYELHRYARRVAARFASELSSDEREDVAAHVLTELYCRYVASQKPSDPLDAGVAGAFMAITLQQVRNTVRLWRAKIGAWVSLEADEYDPEHGARSKRLPDSGSASDPVTRAEQKEQREQVARAFQLAVERYPRARIQLLGVWLHIMEDQSYTSIAGRLKLSVTHARLLTWRGLRRLKGDPDFRVFAQDEQLLDGQRPTRRARPAVTQARELGNE